MSGLRAGKAGYGRDTQTKIDNSFDPEEAKRCLAWLQFMTGETFPIEQTNERYKVMENFYKALRDGFVLCKTINVCLPDSMKMNFQSKTFNPNCSEAFRAARERERIELFVLKCQQYGIPEANLFQTDCLYERTNLWQVCATIRALGTEFESHPSFNGQRWWPRKCEENRRNFSPEILRASEAVISLQYGTNKGANQSGMNFGKKRMIMRE
ncbi:myophilin-like isoform X2 [Gigantopelta aegis]|uniref:myophilin-like isoform X2 n=1 Tax=Gigantopelta aegis TaxID=1735272 RepID=UPI001B889E53|nr:myophilin-like isoform X2 [Gigantopelta aegis]